MTDTSRLTAFLALSCVGGFLTAPAHAQDADKGKRRDAVASDDDRDEASIVVNGRYNQELISPKATAPLVNTPRSIAIISENVIKDTGSATLVDALRTVPGITFGAAEGGNPIGDRPFIRGFDSQGSTYVDGVRDASAQSRETFAVEQIQVVRGSDSSLGGRGSAGGSLNIITKLPRDRDFASAELSYGTADYKRITADLNYTLTDDIAFRVAGMWHDQDVAGRDAIWQKRWGVAPSITIGMSSPTQLTASWYHLDTDELPDTGIPYFYTIGNAPLGSNYSEPRIGTVTTNGGTTGTVDRSTFYGLTNRDFRESKTDQFTIRAQHDFGGVTLRNTSRYSHNTQAYIFTQPDDQQGNVFGNSATPVAGNITGQGGYVWRRANSRYGYVDNLSNQTDLFGKFKTGSIEHSFSVGAEFSWEKARRGSFNVTTRNFTPGTTTNALACNDVQVANYNCTSLFAPNANDPWINYVNGNFAAEGPITKTLPIQETQNDADTQSVYLFDSITFAPWLIANFGLRYDSFKSTVTPGQAATATSSFQLSRSDNLFNWQAGLVVKPTPNTSIYASYATSATPPNSLIGEGSEGNGLGTTNTPAALALLDALKVEKTKSYEVGAKADLFNSRLSLNVALFKTQTTNARVTGPNNTIEFIGEREIKGVEFGFNGEILPKWSVFGGYTYMDAKITDGGFTALTAAAVTGQAAKTVLVNSVNTGRQFPQTAKHSFSLWSNLEVLPKLNIGGGAFYMSRVFGGYSDNRTATQNSAGVVTINPATKFIARSIPGYWRFDARAGYEFNDKVAVSVNVQNLTNKVYFNQAFTAHYAGIAPGRSAFATLSLKY